MQVPKNRGSMFHYSSKGDGILREKRKYLTRNITTALAGSLLWHFGGGRNPEILP